MAGPRAWGYERGMKLNRLVLIVCMAALQSLGCDASKADADTPPADSATAADAPPFPDADGSPAPPRPFRVAVLADTHIIDDYYTGPESSPLDTESIFRSAERLEHARDAIARTNPRPVLGFVCGDIFHNYASDDADFLRGNETRIDRAKALFDSFPFPVWPAWGNHDYDPPEIPVALSHALFEEKFGVAPYYVVEHEGWDFILLSSELGPSWDPASARFDSELGSFGQTRLQWLDARLAAGRPTVIMWHHPLFAVMRDELPGAELPDLFTVLERHKTTVKLTLAGHMHVWLDMTGEYPVPHYGVASTRYNGDNYWILEIDPQAGTVAILDFERAAWFSYDPNPFDLTRLGATSP